MHLHLCRECEFYIMDDGREVSCQFNTPTAYYEIRPGRNGGEVHRCPGELVRGKVSAVRIS